MQMAERCRVTHASSKWTSLDDTMREFNLLKLNSTVLLFLEPERLKQFVVQTSQGRTAGDTQAGSVPATLAKFTSAVFLPLLVNAPRKSLPARKNIAVAGVSEWSIALKRKGRITALLGYGKPSFSSAGIICSLAWFTRLLKLEVYCLGFNVRLINSALTRNPFGQLRVMAPWWTCFEGTFMASHSWNFWALWRHEWQWDSIYRSAVTTNMEISVIPSHLYLATSTGSELSWALKDKPPF